LDARLAASGQEKAIRAGLCVPRKSIGFLIVRRALAPGIHIRSSHTKMLLLATAEVYGCDQGFDSICFIRHVEW
jgi:hypothetical protein